MGRFLTTESVWLLPEWGFSVGDSTRGHLAVSGDSPFCHGWGWGLLAAG